MSEQTKLDRVLEATSGRFFTLSYATSKNSGSLCAKLVNAGPQYITVRDVNQVGERRIKRSSITAARCGSLAYNA